MPFSANYTFYKYKPVISTIWLAFNLLVILLGVNTSEYELFWLVDSGNS